MRFTQATVILTVFTCTLAILETSACAGCIQLTEYTFDKLVSKFDATVVKFDVAFPYGDKHESYSELAKDAKLLDQLLFAEVCIKDYGERDNEELAKRFGVKKDDYPVVKMFLRGKKEPVTFPKDKEFSADNLRLFVKEKSGIHLSLPGCLPQLDTIALKFMKAKDEQRRSYLSKAEIAVAELDESKKSTGKTYHLLMQKVLEKGDAFIASENERVKKLLDGKLSADKKKELITKLNILLSFSEKSNPEKKKKDEF